MSAELLASLTTEVIEAELRRRKDEQLLQRAWRSFEARAAAYQAEMQRLAGAEDHHEEWRALMRRLGRA